MNTATPHLDGTIYALANPVREFTVFRRGSSALTVLIVILFGFAAATSAWAQAAGDFRSIATGDWNSSTTWERFNGTIWQTGAYPTNSTVGVITIQSGHTVTITAAVTNDQTTIASGGQVTVGSGVTWTLNDGAGTDLSLNGTLNVLGTIGAISAPQVVVGGTLINAGALGALTLTFNVGSLYQHDQNAGTVPTATWNAASTCEIVGVTTIVPTAGLAQTFGHFTWNCASQSAVLNLAGNPTATVGGNFTVASTGSGSLTWTVANTARTVTGNLNIQGGTFVYSSGTTGARTLTVSGDLNISGGTFDFSTTAVGTPTLNLGGNYNQTGGTFQNSTGTLAVNFTGTGKTFTQSAGTLTTANMNFNVNSPASLTLNNDLSISTSRTLTVASGATLNCGTSLVTGAGAFTLAAGGTLGIGDAAGITTSGATGNIQVSGTRTYTSGASYIYNGTVAQVTGNGLPTAATAILNLTINNSSGIALSGNASLAAAGTLKLTGGLLDLNGKTLTLASGANISRADGSLSAAPTLSGTVSVTYTGATGPVTTGLELPTSASVLNNLTNSSAGQTVTLNAALAVGGTFNNGAGTFDTSAANNYAVTLNGSFLNTGTLAANSSTITIAGNSANPAIAGFATAGPLQFIRTASTATLNGDVTAASLTMNGAGTLNLGLARTHQFNGNVTFTTGTLNCSSSTLGLTGDLSGNTGTLTIGTSTILFNGTGAQAMSRSSVTFNNLTVNKASGTLTAGADFIVDGLFTITAGDFNASSRAIELTASGLPLVVAGTFTPGTSTVRYTSTAANNAIAGVPYNNLTIAAGAVSDLFLATNGTFSVAGDLTITAGTLDLSANSADRTSSGGVLTLANSAAAKLRIGGANALPANYATHSIGASSTIEYAGTTQVITPLNSAQSYGNLTTSGTGTKTIGGAIEVLGTLTVGSTAPVVVQSGGSLRNTTTTFTLTGSLSFNTGALYQHNRNGTAIPTATWDPASTCEIIVATTAVPTGASQAFGHFIWNPAAQAANNLNFAGALTNVRGNLTIVGTGTTGSLRLTGNTTVTTSIGGNLIVQGGKFVGGNGTGINTINLAGDLTITGGTFDLKDASGTSGGGCTLNASNNVTIASGATLTGSNGARKFNFAKAGIQTFSNAGTSSGTNEWTVNASSVLQGSGALAGPLVVNGSLAPGSSIGALTLNTPPNLNGTLLIEINPTNSPTADLLTLTTGILTNSSSLVVTNIGPMPTGSGVFTVLSATNYTGGFASLTLPAGGTNHWKTNNLNVDGTISFTNNAPVARSVSTSVAQGGVATINFDLGKYKLATDADGDSVRITSVSGATNANLGVAPDGLSMTYTNTGGSADTFDGFTYTVSDGVGGLATNTVAVHIEAGTGFNLLSVSGNTLTYVGIPGASYALENTATLVPATWIPVITNAVGTDGRLVFNLDSPSGFYRTRYVSGP